MLVGRSRGKKLAKKTPQPREIAEDPAKDLAAAWGPQPTLGSTYQSEILPDLGDSFGGVNQF